MNLDDYTFGARIADTQSEWAELEIRPFGDESIRHFKSVWKKLNEALLRNAEYRGADAPHWARWKPWAWAKEAGNDREGFCAWLDGTAVGFVNVREPFTSAADDSQLLYIEHVATFPGNMTTSLWNRRLADVGVSLVGYCACQAQKRNLSGLALHSVEESLSWWQRVVPEKLGIEAVFSDATNGVQGFHEGNAEQPYLETQPGALSKVTERFLR